MALGSARARTRSAETTRAAVMGPRLLVIVSTVALCGIGLVMVFSASSVTSIVEFGDAFADARRQLIFLGIGVVACFLIARFLPYHWWQGVLTWVAFAGSVFLLVLTAVMGTEGLGAQRWLVIGGFNMQPSEFAKIGLLLFAAKTTYDYRQGAISQKTFFVYATLLHLIIVGLILIAQSDMGTSMICIVGIIAILWLAEVNWKFLAVYFAGIAVVVVAALSRGYRFERLMSFTDPWKDSFGTGYQLIHSFYAFAQGGLFGTGLGNSAEKYQYLPEAHTDFIFAVIGEELGLFGALLVVVLFLVFLYGGIRMADEAPDGFGRLICGSFAVIITFQAFLNMAMAMGIMPITGKPLPFVSAGGSSLIASLMMVGIMLSVSYASDGTAEQQRRRDDLRLIHTNAAQGQRPRNSSSIGRASANATRSTSSKRAGTTTGSRARGSTSRNTARRKSGRR